MDLRPCPFCGAEANIWHRDSRYGGFYEVRCEVCGAKTRPVGAHNWEFDSDDEFCNVHAEAVKKLWNHRTTDAEA